VKKFYGDTGEDIFRVLLG